MRMREMECRDMRSGWGSLSLLSGVSGERLSVVFMLGKITSGGGYSWVRLLFGYHECGHGCIIMMLSTS